MSKILTFGFAVYGEFDSFYQTVEGLRANHDVEHELFDLVVVDNAPHKDNRFEGLTKAAGGRYFWRPDLNGTSRPRDACFRLSKTPWTAVGDAHIVLENGSVQAMIDYARAHPMSNDIISGILIDDAGNLHSNQWNQPHPPGLWGAWEAEVVLRNAFYSHQGARSAKTESWLGVRDSFGKIVDPSISPRQAMDAIPPFEINSNGLGLWFMRTEAWPGFNEYFRGFGGEEGYIHEKIRRLGGKAICLPTVRWRHKFRDMGNKWEKPPYQNLNSDHIRNMVIGHREVGIDPIIIKEKFGKKVDDKKWSEIEEEAKRVQPFGVIQKPQRLNIAVLWYSNNSAPESLLLKSLGTIYDASTQSQHNVHVATCSWLPVKGNPFTNLIYNPGGKRGHGCIVDQQKLCLESIEKGMKPDLVVYCEHDVLYPPDYFDRMARAFLKTKAKVIANNDYMGMNATGYLMVKELHQPLHQIAMKYEFAKANLLRAEQECQAQGWAYLEPDHGVDRKHWAFIPPLSITPAIHVNHLGTQIGKRLTSHGEVVFNADSGGYVTHPYYGPHSEIWPHEVTAPTSTLPVIPSPTPDTATGGCGTCKSVPEYTSMKAWVDAEKVREGSDFSFHIDKIIELANKCERVGEVSLWDIKPALVALCASNAKYIWSASPVNKAIWPQLIKLTDSRLDTVQKSALMLPTPEKPLDLIYLDMNHSGDEVYNGLVKYAPHANRFLVIHCTKTYGDTGDDGKQPGVMGAIRAFLINNREWTVVYRVEDNHGLVVLSKNDEDRKDEPGWVTKGLNFSRAYIKHQAAGAPVVKKRVFELRMAECIVCPERTHDTCAACGCPLMKKLTWATEGCGLAYKNQPMKFEPTTNPDDILKEGEVDE